MPTYVYRCEVCGARREAFRSIDDRDDTPVCPLCVAPTMKRLIAYGVQIVASRWYDKEGIANWPTGIGEKDKLEARKQWDRENDASWEHKDDDPDDAHDEPVKPSRPQSAVDIYKSLTEDAVQKVLQSA